MFTILSALDDRARPKGSRDPLGIESIWTFLGRQAVGNLTTVTANLENFIVALWCCYYANLEGGDVETVQLRYMRAEQLAAYLKLSANSDGFLGITQAKKNWHAGRLLLGRGKDAQILSNQLSYGLWGLYSSAMQGAGLIDGTERKLTAPGQALVKQLSDTLGAQSWKALVTHADATSLRKDAVATLGVAFVAALKNNALRKTVSDALLAGQAGASLQGELFHTVTRYFDELGEDSQWSAHSFCTWALARPDLDARLRQVLMHMQDLQPLLVLADCIMSWLQTKAGATMDELRDVVQDRLNTVVLRTSWLQDARLPHRGFLQKLLQAVQDGNPAAAIHAVCEQNRTVMLERGGAPWVELAGQKLTVRVADERFSLPADLDGHCQKWSYTFFLGSFLNVLRQGRT